MALNGTLSFPLPIKGEVPQSNVLCPVLFLVFINDLSDSLENLLYLFADDATFCRDVPHPSDRQAGRVRFPLFKPLTKSQAGKRLGICLSILPNLTLTIAL